MGDLADVYDGTRRDIAAFVEGLDEADRHRPVPATPGWTVRDVISHLTGDIDCVLRGDFPREFFESMGDERAVEKLNRWTAGHVERRRDMSLSEVLEEWDGLVSKGLLPLLREEAPWPEGVPFIAGRVLITDLGVHQQDLYGAFGIERDRESATVKLGSAGYIVTFGLRLAADGVGTLRFATPEKEWLAGGDEPDATVRASRFEFFRALSGRRSMEQIKAYEWEGDPEPFLPYFYLYGVRQEALIE